MNKAVDQDVLAFVKAVDAIMHDRTGVRLPDLQTDLKALRDGLGDVSRAHRSGATPESFSDSVIASLDMAPVGTFASPEEAREVNRRRAALATMVNESDDWKAGRHMSMPGTIVRNLDGEVQQISVGTSREGNWGFSMAVAPNAEIVDADTASDGISLVPPNAEFRHVASGMDIKDAIQSFDLAHEAEASPTPSI